jgi:hypothetical protein
MIPKSGYRFSKKIMLKQKAKAKYRFNLKSFRFRPKLGGTKNRMLPGKVGIAS